jgi:hypothetical protein
MLALIALGSGAAPVFAARAIHAVGVTSWYGPGSLGRRTATGARFNMHKMTAAPRRLPLDHRAAHRLISPRRRYHASSSISRISSGTSIGRGLARIGGSCMVCSAMGRRSSR